MASTSGGLQGPAHNEDGSASAVNLSSSVALAATGQVAPVVVPARVSVVRVAKAASSGQSSGASSDSSSSSAPPKKQSAASRLLGRNPFSNGAAAEAMAMAQSFASGPRHALALAKAAIDQGLEGSLEDGLLLEQALFVKSFATPDAAVGVKSFLSDGPGHAEFG